MNRNAGLALVVAFAVTAAVRLPSAHTPAAATEVESPKSTVSSRHPHPASEKPVYSGGCTAYDAADEKALPDENRGAAKSVLDKFFYSDHAQDTSINLLRQTGVRYAIVLAADPRRTNLSLVFDRQMAVIQQAAQDEQYTYDSSWLPWQVDDPAYPLLADQQAGDDLASHREACPGILLFRRSAKPGPGEASTGPYEGALVVLVVGEQPTGGVNQDQWRNAILWLTRNASSMEAAGTAVSGALSASMSQQDRQGATGSPPAAQPRVLRVLGPSFSGSLFSLARNLDQIYPAQLDASSAAHAFSAKFPEVRVLSGSVSDCQSIRWFQQLRWAPAPGGDRPSVVFGTFTENDDRQIYSFLSYLKSQGTEANDTAILSEDETAYSGSAEQAGPVDAFSPSAGAGPATQPCSFPYASEHRPLRLFFPRDISALRHAYEKQSIFASSSSGSTEHGGHSILQESGEQVDEGNAPDTIRAYSSHLTPIAQEALLYGIVSYLRAHHTRYLMLRCSNPLDFLFLTRFFHRAYPEGRIVIIGSDLLFRREIDTTEFRGVFSLTNYPLLPRNQHWSMLSERTGSMQGHAHRAFETATTEGTYLASRYLFSAGRELAAPKLASTWLSLPLKEWLPEYADPFWLHQPRDIIKETRAPTWLVVIGAGGYWPIAALSDASTPGSHPEKNATGDADKPPPPSTMVRLTSRSAHYELDRDGTHFYRTLRSQLPLPWTICTIVALLLLLYQVCGIVLGDSNASNGLFSIFRKVAAPSQDILLGVNSAFAAMLLVTPLGIGLAIPGGDLFASTDWEYRAFVLLGGVGIVAIAIGLVRKRGWRAAACFVGLFTLLAGLSFWSFEVTIGWQAASQANGIPLFYRIGHLTSGVAPLLPVLFILSGFYLWTWHAMAGNVLLCNGRPTLPKLEGVEARSGFARWYWVLIGNPVDATGAGTNRLKWPEVRMSQELGKSLVAMASPISLPREVILLPVCLALGSWVCFHSDLPLLSMEGSAFAWWLNLGLLFAYLLIAAEASRIFWTWIELRRLLSKLNRTRLRRTFARLRAVEASSLWGMSGNAQRVQYRFFSQQLEAAGRLAALTSHLDWPGLKDAVECGHVFDCVSAHRASRGSRWDRPVFRPRDLAAVSIRDVFADAVAEVLNLVLCPWWGQEDASLTLANTAAKSDEEKGTVPDLPLSDDPVIRTAEEFVCFHYIAFIQNILARMRTMTMSMVLLFVAVALAISFYPFVPRTQISMWMIVGLAIIGSSVIYVYAGLDRDEIMSYITNTRPGRLSPEFWLKTAAFLAGPVIGIVTTQFPAVADSILGWVQPGLDAIGR